jgi:predicted RNA-binding Zn-ribbon protein involved in translation (DUF1610 family)
MATAAISEPVCPKCKTPLPPGTPLIGFEPGPIGPSQENRATQVHTCSNCGYEGPFEAP